MAPRGTSRTGRAPAAVAAALVLAGCAGLDPWTRDPDDAAESAGSEPAARGQAASGQPESALEVAVLDPDDYERDVDRRKQALARTLEEGPAAGDTGYYLDVQEAQLRQALGGTGIGLIREDPRLRLRISGTEAFATGSAELSPAIEESLATIAEVLADYRLTLVVVHGHTDPAGDADVNQRLSEARAVAVARRLVASGLAAERIVTVGHGESRPLAHDTSPDSRWPDRRIEIELELIGR